jgi:hypothetical protein
MKPWEKYSQGSATQTLKPWEKYGQSQPAINNDGSIEQEQKPIGSTRSFDEESIVKNSIVDKIMNAVAPRSMGTEEDSPMRQKIAAAISDIASLLNPIGGRATTSLPALIPGGESFGEAMARTKAPEDAGTVRSFIENVGRDPALAVGGISGILKTPVKGAIAKAVTGGVIEGAASATAHQAERYGETGEVNIPEAAGEIALSAGMGLAGGIAKKAITKGSKELADKVLTSYLKPLSKVFNEGFDAANIEKYGLYGNNVNDILKKSQGEISIRMNQLKELLEQSGNSGNKVDMADAVLKAVKEIESNKTKFPQLFLAKKNEKIPLKEAAEEIIGMIARLSGGADADPLTANEIAQTLGVIASKAFGKNTKQDDALEAVAMTTYWKLRELIESSVKDAPGEVRRLNREMHEIIPIKNAALRRLPIDKRNEFIPLKTMIGGAAAIATGNPAKAGAIAGFTSLDLTLKNPRFAQVLNYVNKVSRKNAPTILTITKKASQATRSNLFRYEYDDEN